MLFWLCTVPSVAKITSLYVHIPYMLGLTAIMRGVIIHRRQLVCLHVQTLQSILWMGLAGQNVKVGQVAVNLTAVAVR
jgi:hypothetical protein